MTSLCGTCGIVQREEFVVAVAFAVLPKPVENTRQCDTGVRFPIMPLAQQPGQRTCKLEISINGSNKSFGVAGDAVIGFDWGMPNFRQV